MADLLSTIILSNFNWHEMGRKVVYTIFLNNFLSSMYVCWYVLFFLFKRINYTFRWYFDCSRTFIMICSKWVIVRVRPRVLPSLVRLSSIILILQVNLSIIFEKLTLILEKRGQVEFCLVKAVGSQCLHAAFIIV